MREKKKNECGEEMPPGLASRVAVSIVVCFGWLIFLVVFLWFYAGDFGVFRSLAVIIISILVGLAILAPMWVYWGIKTGHRWAKEQGYIKKTKKRRARK